MRAPSPRILRNTVTIQPVNFLDDGDGGRVPTPDGRTSAPVRCRVQPASSKDVPDHLREEGVAYYTVHFFGAEPAIRIRDLLNWTDFTLPKVLTATGPPTTAAGERATWLVPCEYRVPPQPGQP